MLSIILSILYHIKIELIISFSLKNEYQFENLININFLFYISFFSFWVWHYLIQIYCQKLICFSIPSTSVFNISGDAGLNINSKYTHISYTISGSAVHENGEISLKSKTMSQFMLNKNGVICPISWIWNITWEFVFR